MTNQINENDKKLELKKIDDKIEKLLKQKSELLSKKELEEDFFNTFEKHPFYQKAYSALTVVTDDVSTKDTDASLQLGFKGTLNDISEILCNVIVYKLVNDVYFNEEGKIIVPVYLDHALKVIIEGTNSGKTSYTPEQMKNFFEALGEVLKAYSVFFGKETQDKKKVGK